MTRRWSPAFGAQVDGAGVRFRVCAPAATDMQVLIDGLPALAMTRRERDTFEVYAEGVRAGDRYRYRMDGHAPWPDPCARWQPEGVHGPSMVIDPEFPWTDAGWRGVPRHRLVIYELHVGTFTPEGTFAAAAARLPALVELGVTAIELMPIAAFPGRWNWGYDGAALFAPSERYGHPDDLRQLVDTAHGLGLAVLLDVVYNHLGPDGAYLAAYMPTIFTDRHQSPWGRGINLDGPGCADVRRLICDNALQWLLEYHLDGLRLDATHALMDDSPEHLLAQMAREASEHVTGRDVHLIAEDERNLDTLLLATDEGGWGMTGVWADDFHHAIRRHVAGDHEAWFSDFTGTTSEIAVAVRDGWIFSGQHAAHYDGPRGTSPQAIPIEAPVVCLQNHDQVGNRAHGERLHHQLDVATWLAATVLLCTVPETPMLFMGQEWAASSPFLYFTDHDDVLGSLVIEGRRNEFRRFSAFADPLSRDLIPSPQAASTFAASALAWDERSLPRHAHVLAETQALLAIRRVHLGDARDRTRIRCAPLGSHALCLSQPSSQGGRLITYVDFDGTGPRDLELAGEVVVLHATRPAADRPTLRGIREADGRLTLEAAREPFGLVLHHRGDTA